MNVRTGSCRGVTIIELLVALVMAAGVVTAVFYSWTALNRQISRSRQRNWFLTESRRIFTRVESDLRTSPAILHWDEVGVTCVQAGSGDTLTYSVQYGELQCNDRPLAGPDSVQVTRFQLDIEPVETQGGRQRASCSLQMSFISNDERFSTSYEALVAVTLAPEPVDESDDWYF